MAIDDYCGAGVVVLDRCERCELVWLGPEQLGAMSMLWARMNQRIDLVYAFNEERLKDAGDFVDVTLIGRAMAGMLGRQRLGYDSIWGSTPTRNRANYFTAIVSVRVRSSGDDL